MSSQNSGFNVRVSWQRLSLPKKVAISAIVSLVPLVGLALQVSNSATSVLRDELQQNVGLSTEVENERIERALRSTSQGLFEIAFDPQFAQVALLQADSETENQTTEFDEYLTSVLSRWSGDGVVGLAVYDESGNLVSQAGALSTETVELANRTGTAAQTETGAAFLVETNPRLPLTRRIYPAGTTQNSVIVAAEWDLALLLGLQDGLSTAGDSATTRLLAPTTEETYLILDATDRETVGTYVAFDLSPFSEDEIRTAHARTDRLTENGVPIISAAAEVANTGWITLVTVSQDDAYAELREARRYIVGMFILAGLAMIIIGTVIFRNFVQRLRRVASLAEAIAGGDLTGRTGDDSSDALGHLSATFDQMAVSLANDIARRERVEAQLAYQASHDALTGLPNRTELVAGLEKLLVQFHHEISVLFVDLDGFKQVNDRLGHAAGDELLVRVADRLREITRPTDLVVRLGGDEFVIVLPGLDMHEAEAIAERIVSALELPYVVGGDEASISASIGIAAAGDDRSSERILKEADLAMYRAKALGKGRGVRLHVDFRKEVSDKGIMLTELRHAISGNDLNLRLRPIGDLRDGTLLGVELSAAWDHPERGLLHGEELGSLVENAGFATQLDEWTIRSAARIYERWQERGLAVDGIQIAINISTQSFESQRTRHILARELSRVGIRPANFRLEVPETVLRGDPAVLSDAFDGFRAMGIPIMLDDFGADFTNIEEAPRYALDSAKIDLNRLNGIASGSPTSRALVESLVNLANSGGLRAAVRGVDDEYLRDLMISFECIEAQGDWLCPEFTPEEFVAYFESSHQLAPV